MFALLAQLAPEAGHGFWRPPSAWTVVDIALTVALAVAVVLLWRRFTRWRKTTAPLLAQVVRVISDLDKVQADIVEIRHDVNAVGEKVAELGTGLATDIIESEERIVKKLAEVADAQIALMQTLSSRPCVLREKDVECPESET